MRRFAIAVALVTAFGGAVGSSAAVSTTRPAPTTGPAERQLSVDERKAIFADTAVAEDRATREADAKCPPKDEGSVEANAKLWRALTEKYKNEVARLHKVTRDQMTRINVEGVQKKWPPLND